MTKISPAFAWLQSVSNVRFERTFRNVRRLLLLLSCLGFIAITPILWLFPIYQDEVQWKFNYSRLLIDGKMIGLTPVCEKGFVLATPISWLPSRLFDAVLYEDMTNPQRLRYYGVILFLLICVYFAWLTHRLVQPRFSGLFTFGAVLSAISFGVLPFILVVNRPEQSLIIPLLVGCSLPVLMQQRVRGLGPAFVLAILYVFLTWSLMAAHIKGLFVLPALLVAGCFVVRRRLSSLVMVGLSIFAAAQTFVFWNTRVDCPESPFLSHLLRSLSVSTDDLSLGAVHFLLRISANIVHSYAYWRQATFQSSYQSDWLPAASSSLTVIERVMNFASAMMWILAIFIVLSAIVAAGTRALRQRALPSYTIVLAGFLVSGLFLIVMFQTGKNFYEPAYLAPLLGLAVIFSLPDLMRIVPHARNIGAAVISAIAILAFVNDMAVIIRFGGAASDWKMALMALPEQQSQLRGVLDRCGVVPSRQSNRIIMDKLAYTVLWPTRQPFFMQYFDGYYATGLDQEKLVREKKVSALVGICTEMPQPYRSSSVSDGTYCCSKVR